MQRSVDIETVCALLTIVLRSQFPLEVDLLIEYLKVGIIFSQKKLPSLLWIL